MREHPDIDISLFASHEPARLGQDGILIDIQYARPVPETCEAIVLAEEMIVPMASPAFVAEHHVGAIADIGRVPLLHSLRCVVQWPQWSARFAPGLTLNPRGFQFDRAHLALASAADGLGIVLESTLQANPFLAQRRIVMPFGEVGFPVVAHRLVFRREDDGHPELLAFIDWITRAFRSERLNSGPR